MGLDLSGRRCCRHIYYIPHNTSRRIKSWLRRVMVGSFRAGSKSGALQACVYCIANRPICKPDAQIDRQRCSIVTLDVRLSNSATFSGKKQVITLQ